MALEFCPVCRKILQIKEFNGKYIGVCSCGFKRMSGIDVSFVDNSKGDALSRGEGAVKESNAKIEKLTHEDKKDRKADF